MADVRAQSPAINVNRFAVFIDQVWDSQPDFNVKRLKSPIGEGYIEAVNASCKRVQDSLGVEVMVALHPERLSKNPFSTDGFSHFTGDLIKRSEFVVAHYSLAINYEVLCKKPVLVMATSQINSLAVFKHAIDFYAEALSSRVQDFL